MTKVNENSSKEVILPMPVRQQSRSIFSKLGCKQSRKKVLFTFLCLYFLSNKEIFLHLFWLLHGVEIFFYAGMAIHINGIEILNCSVRGVLRNCYYRCKVVYICLTIECMQFAAYTEWMICRLHTTNIADHYWYTEGKSQSLPLVLVLSNYNNSRKLQNNTVLISVMWFRKKH